MPLLNRLVSLVKRLHNAINELINDMNKRRLLDAVEREFALRRVTKSSNNADIAVSLNVIVSVERGVTAYTDYYSMGGYGYYPSMGYGGSTTTYQSYDYKQGTLILDVFDVSTKQMVWQGMGIGTLPDDPSKAEKTINKYMSSIMQKYPVRAAEIK